MAVEQVQTKVTYDSDGPSLKALVWLESDGELQATPTSCTISVYDEDHTLVYTQSSSSSTRGIFSLSQSSPTLLNKTGYYIVAAIINNAVTRTSCTGFTFVQ